jgi:hypothetical protein
MTTTPVAACTNPLEEPQVGTRDRAITYFWPLTEEPAKDYYSHGWNGIELCVYHDRDRKRFWTSLHPTTKDDDGGSLTSLSLMAAPQWHKVQPVARYSAKALAAFAEAALAEFRAAYTDGHEGVRALFAPPA